MRKGLEAICARVLVIKCIKLMFFNNGPEVMILDDENGTVDLRMVRARITPARSSMCANTLVKVIMSGAPWARTNSVAMSALRKDFRNYVPQGKRVVGGIRGFNTKCPSATIS